MAKLLNQSLPIPPREYKQGMFNQLIRILQRTLMVDVPLPDDVDETEAINFFLSN